jgi:hypothetical protein
MVKREAQRLNLKFTIPYESLPKFYTHKNPRDMRDFDHLTELIPAIALFHLFNRKIIFDGAKHLLVPSPDDALKAMDIFDKINDITKTGTDPETLRFYTQFIKPYTDGILLTELTDDYNKYAAENGRKRRTDRTIRRWVYRLEDIGYVNIREETFDRTRRDRYYPLDTDLSVQGSLDKTDATLDTRLTNTKCQVLTDLNRSILEKEFNLCFKNPHLTRDTLDIETRRYIGCLALYNQTTTTIAAQPEPPKPQLTLPPPL